MLICYLGCIAGKSHTNVRLRKDAESKFNFSNLPIKEASMEEPSNKRLRDGVSIYP